MKNMKCFVILVTLLTILVTGCGRLQEDTNLSDDINVGLRVGYIEDGTVFVNDIEGKEISFKKEEEIASDFEDYEKTEYPLLGKIEDEDVYLYENKGKGAILVKGEFVQYLDLGSKGFFTPRGILPELHSGDFDGDSKSEIAILLYVGSGTAVSFEELYILDDDEAYEEYYKVLALSKDEYSRKLEDSLRYSVDESDNIKLKIGRTESDLGKIEGFKDFGCGDITYFLVKGEDISIVSKLGVSTEEINSLQYEVNGWIKAAVVPSESGFDFKEIEYEVYDHIDEKEQKFLR